MYPKMVYWEGRKYIETAKIVQKLYLLGLIWFKREKPFENMYRKSKVFARFERLRVQVQSSKASKMT